MALRWTLAFVIATWIALGGCAALRHIARMAAAPSSTASALRRRTERGLRLRALGGGVLAVAALTGWLALPRFDAELAVTALAGAALVLVGLVGERTRLPGWVWPFTLLAGSVAVVAAGVRAEPLGISGVDVGVTVVWVALVAYAFGRLDHADGLACATGLAAASGVFGVAARAGSATSVVAAALTGACLGVAVYNVRPASIAVGRGGAGFVGLVVAVMAVEMEPLTDGAGTVVVPLLIVAVPLLDLGIVTLSRLWHGLPLGRSRRDHLVHRLQRRGVAPGLAIAVIAASQAVLALIAVMVGRDFIPPVLGMAVAAAVVAALVNRTLEGAPPRSRPDLGRRRLVGAVIGAFVVLVAVAAFAIFDGLRELRAGQAALEAALDAGRSGDADGARVDFLTAADAFSKAESRLDGPFTLAVLGVPIVSDNLRAAQTLAASGAELSEAGASLAVAGGERLRVVSGTVRVDEVRRLTPEIEAAAQLVRDASTEIGELRRSRLVGPVRDRVDEALDELTQAVDEAEDAVAAAHVAPAIFGGDGERRYFLAVQNPAELRGTGGIMGNWGVITARDGHVDLDDFHRTRLLNEDPPRPDSPRQLAAPLEYIARYGRFAPAQIWQNANMSPDFPTVGSIMADLFPQSGGQPVDGVIGVDPVGLQALLRLTGPVTIDYWNGPITADNVIDITLRQAYEVFEGDTREEFLGDVAEAVWERATQVDLGNPARMADVLSEATREGHLSLWFADPEEQALAARLGVAGEVPPIESDSLLVVNQNASANKVDYYLQRSVAYDVALTPDPSRRRADVQGQVEVRMTNGAPEGVSGYAFGPWNPSFLAGENRSLVSVYTPLALTGGAVDGQPRGLETATELDRNVFSSYVSVPAQSSRALEVGVAGSVRLERGGWYSLDLVRQPTLLPDDVAVTIEVAPEWRIVDVRGLEIETPRRAGARIELDRTTTVRLQVAPAES